MRKTIFILAIILSLLSAAYAGPTHRQSTRNIFHSIFFQDYTASGDAVIGVISDSHCKFKHMDGMESAACVHHCQSTGAKIVLIDREKNTVYTLDEEGQKTAQKFAGQKVKVTGHVMESMIHVEKIEAAE
jgi:hypothetical protein